MVISDNINYVFILFMVVSDMGSMNQ